MCGDGKQTRPRQVCRAMREVGRAAGRVRDTLLSRARGRGRLCGEIPERMRAMFAQSETRRLLRVAWEQR